jgi:hypothetical protein
MQIPPTLNSTESMKTTHYYSSGIARVGACFVATLCLGVASASALTSVSVPLGGKAFGNGRSIFVNSGTQRLDKALSYTYTVKGTCHGTGAGTVMSALAPSSISFKGLLNSFKRGSGSFLTGVFSNPGGKFPISVIEIPYSRSISTDNGPITIDANIVGGVRGGTGPLNGQAYFNITEVSIVAAFPITIGTLEFDPGAKLVITVNP